MGGVVNSVARAASDVVKNPVGTVSGAVGNIAKNPSQLLTLGVPGAALNAVFNGSPDAPEAPGVDPTLDAIKQRQLQQAKEFRSNLPGMKSSAAQTLQQEANQQLQGQLKGVTEDASSRGLLYSGIAEKNKGRARGQSQANLSKALKSSNVAYDQAANQLDAQAVETAYGIQRSQQQIQNDIYSQSMAQMNAQNQITGAALGTLAGAVIPRMGK